MHFHSSEDYKLLDLPKVSNLILQDMDLTPFTPEQLFFLQQKQEINPDDFKDVQLCFHHKHIGSNSNFDAIKLDITAPISELKQIVLLKYNSIPFFLEFNMKNE